MFVKARWQEMKPLQNSGLKAEKTTIFDFSRYFHFRKHSPHVLGIIDPGSSEKPLKFPNHYSIQSRIVLEVSLHHNICLILESFGNPGSVLPRPC